MTATRVRIPERVVCRAFQGEMVVLDLDSGRYFGLNETAGLMLESLGRTGDVAATAAEVAARTDAPVEQVQADLDQLCRDLASHDLLELSRGR